MIFLSAFDCTTDSWRYYLATLVLFATFKGKHTVFSLYFMVILYYKLMLLCPNNCLYAFACCTKYRTISYCISRKF